MPDGCPTMQLGLRRALELQAKELEQDLAYLEADDFAYSRGLGPHIERLRSALNTIRHQLRELTADAVHA